MLITVSFFLSKYGKTSFILGYFVLFFSRSFTITYYAKHLDRKITYFIISRYNVYFFSYLIKNMTRLLKRSLNIYFIIISMSSYDLRHRESFIIFIHFNSFDNHWPFVTFYWQFQHFPKKARIIRVALRSFD